MSGIQLCTVLQDKSLNGGRDLRGLQKHIETKHLVQLAFAPGTQRMVRPGNRRR
jgi:hypothetical protein